MRASKSCPSRPGPVLSSRPLPDSGPLLGTWAAFPWAAPVAGAPLGGPGVRCKATHVSSASRGRKPSVRRDTSKNCRSCSCGSRRPLKSNKTAALGKPPFDKRHLAKSRPNVQVIERPTLVCPKDDKSLSPLRIDAPQIPSPTVFSWPTHSTCGYLRPAPPAPLRCLPVSFCACGVETRTARVVPRAEAPCFGSKVLVALREHTDLKACTTPSRQLCPGLSRLGPGQGGPTAGSGQTGESLQSVKHSRTALHNKDAPPLKTSLSKKAGNPCTAAEVKGKFPPPAALAVRAEQLTTRRDSLWRPHCPLPSSCSVAGASGRTEGRGQRWAEARSTLLAGLRGH
ncbi:uncharacterized protein LOC116594846 [Mustela erminea]|uniref:uncharacterized protein LOC116594846 n=1 Tax=Mustela erminea TaxID=36723 RepID=UPI001386EA3F|nr:uncharacterized protein LOC116594846 [Mustela erminea]